MLASASVWVSICEHTAGMPRVVKQNNKKGFVLLLMKCEFSQSLHVLACAHDGVARSISLGMKLWLLPCSTQVADYQPKHFRKGEHKFKMNPHSTHTSTSPRPIKHMSETCAQRIHRLLNEHTQFRTLLINMLPI